MVRESFDNTLKALSREVVRMLDLVRDLLEESIDTLVRQDLEGARGIGRKDDAIDRLMEEIEEKSIALIALQQPAAKDLRILFSIVKMVTDIERVGDYAVNIAREVVVMGKEPRYFNIQDIERMRDIILGMLEDTKKSFLEEDAYLALKVGKEDELIDEIYKDFYSDVLHRIHENEDYIRQGTKLLFVGRHLERMADHITNICEKVVYIIRGERIEIN